MFKFLAPFLLLLPITAEAQQISPSPNPAGNSITVATGSDYFNDVFYNNFGIVVVQGGATLQNNKDIYNYPNTNHISYPNNTGDLYVFGTFTNAGVFDNAGYIDIMGLFENQGFLYNDTELANEGKIRVTGTFNNAGYFENLRNLDLWPYSTINNSSTMINGDFFSVRGIFNNNGVFTNHQTTKIGFVGGSGVINNNGFFANSSSGVVEISDTFVNNNLLVNDGVINHNKTAPLPGVTFTNNGSLVNNSIFNNYDDMVNEGFFENSGSMFLDEIRFLDNFGIFENTGSLLNWGDFNNHGTFMNNGTVETFNPNVTYRPGDLINFGTFSGDGTYVGNVVDHGVISPGDSIPSVMTIDGNLIKTAGMFEVYLDGLDVNMLYVTGDAALAGTLNLLALSKPTLEMYEILRVDGILSGFFNGLGEGSLVGNYWGTDMYITYMGGTGNDIFLYSGVSIPEPSFFYVLSALLFALWAGISVRNRKTS